MRIVISSGHGKYVRGASDILDEVDEARRVVNRVVQILTGEGVSIKSFHDNVSRTQNENLHRIVDFHNAQERDLDVSIHFNANTHTTSPMGTECLYVTQADLSKKVSAAIALASGLTNRGPKYRGNLYFLNNTEEPAILIEVCFVDSTVDARLYNQSFEAICAAIAEQIGDVDVDPTPGPEPETDFHVRGTCSSFGGPNDTGVSPSEGLAFIQFYSEAPHLFLPTQPSGTTGLARRLNPEIFYVACRWDYDVTPKSQLLKASYQALVRANGEEFRAWAADWGPNADTGRAVDLSPALMRALGLETDDEVEVLYPAR